MAITSPSNPAARNHIQCSLRSLVWILLRQSQHLIRPFSTRFVVTLTNGVKVPRRNGHDEAHPIPFLQVVIPFLHRSAVGS